MSLLGYCTKMYKKRHFLSVWKKYDNLAELFQRTAFKVIPENSIRYEENSFDVFDAFSMCESFGGRT